MPSSIDLPPTQEAYARTFFRLNVFGTLQPPPKDLNLSGQTGIITGGNSGLGLECASLLLTYGLSRLVLAVRSLKKGQAAAAELRRGNPTAATKIEVWTLDMVSYDSIRAFARRCASDLDRIDFVVLNAGLTQAFRIVESTGHEEVFQVNYLSTALLAILLLPVLRDKRPPPGSNSAATRHPGHITIVSSALAYTASFPNHAADPLIPSFDDPAAGVGLAAAPARYALSKLLGQLFMAKLRDHVSAEDVVVNLVEPGWIRGTGLDRNAPAIVRAILAFIKLFVGRSKAAGAWSYIDAAAVQGEGSHGSFLWNMKVVPFGPFVYSPEGRQAAERLWLETLDQLEFAGVRDILSSMSKRS